MNKAEYKKLKFPLERVKILIGLGRFDEEVLDQLNEILKINPRNEYALNELSKNVQKRIDILNNKGKVLSNNHKYKEAIDVFDKVLEIDPKDTDALKNKEYVLKRRMADILYEKGRDLDKLDKYSEAIEIFDEVLRIDPEFKIAEDGKKHILDDINEWKGATKESALEIIRYKNQCQEHNKFRYAPEEFQSDREFVLNAVSVCGGNMLKYVSSELQANREIVLKAVHVFGWALQYASIELQNDREIVLEAVNHTRDVLSIVLPIFQDDDEIVRTAILSEEFQAPFTTILQNVSPRLRSNRSIVLQAVKNFGMEIQYANPCFYNDEEIIFTAFENRRDDGSEWYGKPHGIYTYISPRLRKKIEEKENRTTSNNSIENFGDTMNNLAEKMVMYFTDYEREKRSEEKYRREEEEKEWYKENKEHQEQWKHDTEQWQSEMAQWQQNQKYESYIVFRVKLEQMPLYERWKKDVIKKCGNKCQLDKSHADQYAEVHHIDSLYSIYLNNKLTSNEEIIKCKKLWDIDNGIVLCKECHDTMESSQKRQTLIQNK